MLGMLVRGQLTRSAPAINRFRICLIDQPSLKSSLSTSLAMLRNFYSPVP
jgi:hypothetical protein